LPLNKPRHGVRIIVLITTTGKTGGGEERGGRAGVGNGEGEKEAMKEEKNLYHFLSIPVHL
jgi:hypothetical protein